jgi:hypothetical protein
MTDQSAERGQLDPEQVSQLLEAVKPYRVKLRDGHSHMEGYDIRAHLTRIFGFAGWDLEGDPAQLIHERELDTGKAKGNGWPAIRYSCAYRQALTLVVYDPRGHLVKRVLGQAVGKAENQPSFGDAHDLALKDAETQALKRAAMNLGDQFGLGLYNRTASDGKGGFKACVKVTLVGMPSEEPGPAMETPEVGDEGDDAKRAADSEPEIEAPPARSGRDDADHVTPQDVEHMKTVLSDLTRPERERIKSEREEKGLSVEWGTFTVGTLRFILTRAAELIELREKTEAALAADADPQTAANQRHAREALAVQEEATARGLEASGASGDRAPELVAQEKVVPEVGAVERAAARRQAGGMKLAPKVQRDKVADLLAKQPPEVQEEVRAWAAENGHTLGDQLQADSVNVVTQAITNTGRAFKLQGKGMSRRGQPQPDKAPEVTSPADEHRALRRGQWAQLNEVAKALGADETWDMITQELASTGISQAGDDHAQVGRAFIEAGEEHDAFVAEMVEQYEAVAEQFAGRPFEEDDRPLGDVAREALADPNLEDAPY